MYRRFASIQNPTKYGYAYESGAMELTPQIESGFRQYETYNDNLVQHSRDWSITREFAPDYLASLATTMLNDVELLESISFRLDRGASNEQIAFAASVIFKADGDSTWRETKDRYYCLEQRKISTQRDKQYDKRWQKVESWNDGSPGAILRMLCPDYASGLHRYAIADSIRNWALSDENDSQLYVPLTAEFLNWGKDTPDSRQYAQDMRHAYMACVNIIRAHQLRSNAETALSNIRPAKPVEQSEVA